MNIIFTIIKMYESMTMSLSQVLSMISIMFGRGAGVLKTLVELLGTEKYATQMEHFKKAVLLALQAITELKTGIISLGDASKANPEDFKFLMEFGGDLEGMGRNMAQSFSGLNELGKMFNKDEMVAKLPDFVKNSAEYKALNIEKNDIEVNAAELIEALINETVSNYGSETPLKERIEKALGDIEVKGYTALYTCKKEEGKEEYTHKKYVYFGQKFEVDIPAVVAEMGKTLAAAKVEREAKWVTDYEAQKAEKDVGKVVKATEAKPAAIDKDAVGKAFDAAVEVAKASMEHKQ